MHLIVDIGNSLVKFSIFKGNGIIDYLTVPTIDFKLDKFNPDGLEFFEKSLHDIEYAAISSVVPDVTEKVKDFVKKYVNKEVFLLSQLEKKIKTDYKGKLGEDRKMAAYAAYKIYGTSTIVVDIGTALTFSLIDGDGVFQGGMISLGPDSLLSALVEKTSQLPKIELSVPAVNVGKNTEEAINAGVFWSILGTIEQCVNHLEEALGERAKVVLTGGYSIFFAQFVNRIVELDPFLVLRGVNFLLSDNLNGGK